MLHRTALSCDDLVRNAARRSLAEVEAIRRASRNYMYAIYVLHTVVKANRKKSGEKAGEW